MNLIVYHGVLAPNAKWRREVVDFGRPPVQRGSSATTPRNVGAPYNRTWAELMRRGLDIDVLECPDCGGRLRFVAAIMLSSAIRRILRHLGLPSDPVELAPARAPPNSTTPGHVDSVRPLMAERLDRCVSSDVVAAFLPLWDAGMPTRAPLFAGLLAHWAQAESRVSRY